MKCGGMLYSEIETTWGSIDKGYVRAWGHCILFRRDSRVGHVSGEMIYSLGMSLQKWLAGCNPSNRYLED